jgi:pantetheine-phosphate adenylyltransferase
MARRCFHPHSGIKVVSFSNLLIDFAYEQGASVIIKGVRNAADFDYESILHTVGKSQKIGIDTHILFADPELAHVSSSAVKAIAKASGDISEYVPLHVKQAVEERICGQYIIGVTGEIGAGKSHIGKLINSSLFQEVHNIELDDIGHDILCTLEEPAYDLVRKEIWNEIGGPSPNGIMKPDGFIDKKRLGTIVFEDPDKLKKLNEIMAKPIMVRLRKEISGKKGIILINCALLAEADLLHICNNNVILIKVDEPTQNDRLLNRGLTEEQINNRMACQYTYDLKKSTIEKEIADHRHGKLLPVDNSKGMISGEIDIEFNEKLLELIDVWV